jgi:hypothetical protein
MHGQQNIKSIRRVQVNQNGLKFNQLLIYADDVNILGGSVYTMKENAEAFLVANKETGLEVNADAHDQTAEPSRSVKIDNSSFERVEEYKYLGKNLTNQNSIQEEIKSRLKSVNACYYSGSESFVFHFATQKFED